ncbi:MAG: condensation domain-containing protein, partial [Cyclobacteriaceae bacterium]
MSKEELLLAFREGKYSAEEVLVLLQQQKKSALSEGQKELWMLQKLYPEMAGFNLPLGLKITEGFNLQTFREACLFMLDQYPILTSHFEEENGIPYYHLNKKSEIVFQSYDATGKSQSDIVGEMRTRFKKPFDLQADQLIRFDVFEVQNSSAYVLITVHHIIFDGTSSVIFIDTLLETYNQLLHGADLTIEKSAVNFADFVQWEQDMLENPESKEHFEFWKEQFKGELPMVAMPSDYLAKGARKFEGTTYETKITGDLLAQVRTFSGKTGVNQAVIFLAAFKAFIYRYTGQEDIIIGMPTAGRPKKVFEDILGYFIYMVSVRTEVSG